MHRGMRVQGFTHSLLPSTRQTGRRPGALGRARAREWAQALASRACRIRLESCQHASGNTRPGLTHSLLPSTRRTGRHPGALGQARAQGWVRAPSSRACRIRLESCQHASGNTRPGLTHSPLPSTRRTGRHPGAEEQLGPRGRRYQRGRRRERGPSFRSRVYARSSEGWG